MVFKNTQVKTYQVVREKVEDGGSEKTVMKIISEAPKMLKEDEAFISSKYVRSLRDALTTMLDS